MNYFSKYRLLTKTILKSNAMDDPKDKGRKIKNIALSIFAVVFVMIPVVVVSGIFTFLATKSLMEQGDKSFMITLMLCFISIFTVIFGINVIFSELYFSSDIEKLLPLPLHPWEIAGARFTAVFIGESVMQCLLVIAGITGYGIAAGLNILEWILAISGGLFLSLAPMAGCAIIGILMMSFTKFIKNKDQVRRISLIFMFLVFVVMVEAILSLSSVDIEEFILNASKGDIVFVKMMKILFPQIILFGKYLKTGNLTFFISYAVISVAFVIVFLLIAEKFYIRSVSVMGDGTAKKAEKLENQIKKNKKIFKKNPHLATLFLKELRSLVRTQVYFTNCILATFIWPLFVFIIIKLRNIDISIVSLESYRMSHRTGNASLESIMLSAGFLIAVIMTAMNSLGSNSFSREGQGIEFIKYIPVDMKIQWNAKALISFFFSAIGTVPFFVAGCIYTHIGVLMSVIIVAIMLAAVFFITYMGMYIDSINPKLEWEDALSSLRENYNTFFAMAIAIIVAALGFLAIFIAIRCGIGVRITAVVLLVLFAIADIWIYKKSMTKGIENLSQLGE